MQVRVVDVDRCRRHSNLIGRGWNYHQNIADRNRTRDRLGVGHVTRRNGVLVQCRKLDGGIGRDRIIATTFSCPCIQSCFWTVRRDVGVVGVRIEQLDRANAVVLDGHIENSL